MDSVRRDLQKPAPWTLLVVGDVVLASEVGHELERQTQAWSKHLTPLGFRLSVKKTDYLTKDVHEAGTIRVDGTDLTSIQVPWLSGFI
ncbi:hypothetical protein Y032_0164g3530 [Ancylostoma ceylanicum]|uniref:Reverse transcriptase domain-containing protein n=1 Tax=Ancylostoma ceylanicum TaxID=53326 RepID=A0A016SXC4_9BILA|nr:hypothetical protein Y032_0164g3530 [Ancylostoma ceylanicum]